MQSPFSLILDFAKGIINTGKNAVVGKGAFSPDTSLGIARNTVLGLPKAGLDVGKDIAQGIARTGVGFGGDVRNAFVSPKDRRYEAQVPKVLQPVLGKQPIKTIAQKVVDTENTLKASPLAQRFGVDRNVKIGKLEFNPLAFGGTIGLSALDLTPLGGLEKNAAKSLAKATTEEAVSGILRTLKIPEQYIIKHAPALIAAKTPKEAENVLRIVKKELAAPSFNSFHIDDQNTLTKYADKIKAGNGALPKDTELVKETFRQYGVNVPENPKQIASQIDLMRQGASNAADNSFTRSLDVASKPKTLADIRAEKQPLNRGFAKNPLASVGGEGVVPPKLPQKAAEDVSRPVLESGVSLDRSIAQRKGITSNPLETLKNAEMRTGTKPLRYSAEGIPLAPTKRQSAIASAADSMSTGEVQSLERQAEQAATREIRDPQLRKASSLPKIIEKSPTPVKAKVNALDYMRTPDKVLAKIGLSKQADSVRTAYDGYVKELPQNIDKITAWAKSLPKESSQKIFKYLDGQAIDITPAEKKVAGEIKTWLAEWADRLGLPKDNRIADYITHIFDDQLIKKEFDEDLAKIIADKVPGSVYNPFLLKRLGAKGYKEDAWAALDAYVKRATRKVHMDPALEKLQDAAGHLEESQWNYVKRFADRINLRPTEIDNLIDNGIKAVFGYRAGQRPVAAITKTLRRATYRGMLGLNAGSALRNLSQGINTYAKLGEKYTALGYGKLFSKANRAELEASGVLSSSFVQDRALSSAKKFMEKVDKGLFYMFETAEKVNRGAAYFGAKAKGIASGMSEEKAIEYAKKIVRDTQFQFGTIDTPVAMSSDIVKTLTQFQTFTTKQIEFLAGMAKNREYAGLIRYALSGIAFVYTIGQAFGMDIKDLVPVYRLGVPPSLKLPYETSAALVGTPDDYGQPRSVTDKLKDITGTLPGYIPGGIQAKKTIQGAQAIESGGSYDAAGRLQFPQGQSFAKKAQTLLFGKYSSKEAEAYFNRGELTKEEKSKVQPIYDQVQKLLESGDKQGALDVHSQLSPQEKLTYKKIKQGVTAEKNIEGKKSILPTYNQIQELIKNGDKEAALKMHSALSDDQKKYYKLVKADQKKLQDAAAGDKPEFNPDEVQSSQSVISTVWTYAKALGVDPATAFDRIFTGQRIRYVSNGTIVVERLPLSESQAEKRAQGSVGGEVKLDHTIPLQLGGSNEKSNLKLVPTAMWQSYTPIENELGKALRAGKITKESAQSLIRDFKKGLLTTQEVRNAII